MMAKKPAPTYVMAPSRVLAAGQDGDRDKGTVVAKLFAHLFGREDHGGPEVTKEVDQTDLDQHVGIRTHLQVRIQEREPEARPLGPAGTPA